MHSNGALPWTSQQLLSAVPGPLKQSVDNDMHQCQNRKMLQEVALNTSIKSIRLVSAPKHEEEQYADPTLLAVSGRTFVWISAMLFITRSSSAQDQCFLAFNGAANHHG